MKYKVITRTVETKEGELDFPIPSGLTGEDIYDRTVHDQAKAGTLIASMNSTLDSKSTILEVWRGDLRIFPRVKKAKVTIKKVESEKDADLGL